MPPGAKRDRTENQMNGVECPIDVQQAGHKSSRGTLHALLWWIYRPFQPSVEEINAKIRKEKRPAGPEIAKERTGLGFRRNGATGGLRGASPKPIQGGQ